MQFRSMLLAGTATVVATAVAVPAAAQDTGAGDENAPAEIVVTAQKRTERLIDVPQSVSVVGQRELERTQSVSIQDIAKLVPGLNLEQNNAGEARIMLRGLNTGGVASTVATYLDETPFGSSSGQVNGAILAGEFDTFDMARIEVLRGPQGTLYGASSLGGVFKFVSNEPQSESLEMRGRVSFETTRGGEPSYGGSALVNIPLSGNAALRASGFYRQNGGYIDSIGTGGSDIKKNINDGKSYGGRVSALFKPSEAFSVRLTAVLQDFDNNGSNVVESDEVTLKTLYGRYSKSQFVPEFTRLKYRLYNSVVKADVGFADLLWSNSYAIQNETLRDDLTPSFGPVIEFFFGASDDIGQNQHTDLTKWTEELRLTSKGDGPLSWLVGGYYTHEKGGIFQIVDALTPNTLDPDPNVPQLFDGGLTSKYEEYAAFTNLTYKFSDQFDLTMGGRYSHNNQSSHQFGTGALAPPEVRGKSDENVFTWSVSPKFKPNDRMSIYARVAKGFRPGGPNIIPPGAPADTPGTYDSDSIISYEVGFKGESADRRLSFDAALFHIDWKRIQLFTIINDVGLNANGGGAKSDGAEASATYRPGGGLTFNANVAYTNAKLKDDTGPLVGGRDGDRLPYTPRFAFALSGDYDFQLDGGTKGFVGATFRHLSRQPAGFDAAFVAANGRQRYLPDYQTLDLRAGVRWQKFSIEAYARNLTDSEGKTSVTGAGNFPNGAIGTGVIRPRSFGLALGASL